MNRFKTPEALEKRRKQGLNKNLLDSISKIENWWFQTWNRVNRTKGWSNKKLTLVKITPDDIVHILRNIHLDYYKDRLDTMIPNHKPEISDMVNHINHDLLPNELAKLDEYVETQITKLVVEKKNKQSQNAFAKVILLPRDVDAWCDIFNEIKRNSLYEPLKNYKYGNKTVEEWYDEYTRRFTDKQNEDKKSKKPKPKPQQPKRPDAREDIVAYPFRSKIAKYRKNNPTLNIQYHNIPSIQRIPEKQLYRPYFCPEIGGWEIDFAFKICNDNDKTDNEENIIDTWLFCVNINTRYLEVYYCAKKSVNHVFTSLDNLIKKHNVKELRGDGEAAFKSQTITSLLNRYHIKFLWNDGKFTNHNRIVDCVIKTIRNAIGYREINHEQLKQIVDYYNNTYHRSIDCTPAEMQNNPDLEHQYIRWCKQKLQQVLALQDSYGMTKYEKGNILLVHLDKGKTNNKFEKRRTYYDRLGEFIEYVNGNVKIKLLTPVRFGINPVYVVEVPSYHTQYLAKNKETIPQEYIRSYTVNLARN